VIAIEDVIPKSGQTTDKAEDRRIINHRDTENTERKTNTEKDRD
jgi:hypothetical protein